MATCRFCGGKALSYEIEDSGPGGSQDLLSPIGLAYAMNLALRTYWRVP